MRDGRHPGRLAGAAGAHRHALAEHEPARSGALPDPLRPPPSHRRSTGRSTRCTTTRIRCRMRSNGSPHSLCTLEFEDHRPLYDWLIARVAEGGVLRQAAAAADRVRAAQPELHHHQQAPAAAAGDGAAIVDGWDDPRMTTLVGPAPARLHARIDPPVLRSHRRREGAPMDRHERASSRRCATTSTNGRPASAWCVDPVRLVITSSRQPVTSRTSLRGAAYIRITRSAAAPISRSTRELWIEREDFSEDPPKGFFRLAPDRMVRLRHGYVVRAPASRRGRRRPGHDRLLASTCRRPVRAPPAPTRSRSRATSTGSGRREAVPVEVRLYDRLFTEAQPDAGGRDLAVGAESAVASASSSG